MFSFFFFNDTATTEIYTLSLHDALRSLIVAEAGVAEPVEAVGRRVVRAAGRLDQHIQTHHEARDVRPPPVVDHHVVDDQRRSEEHTSELQSRQYLVCRLLLEKKKILCY